MEALDSDLWVSAGCANGLGLWSISIPGKQPLTQDGYAPRQPLHAGQHIITATDNFLNVNKHRA